MLCNCTRTLRTCIHPLTHYTYRTNLILLILLIPVTRCFTSQMSKGSKDWITSNYWDTGQKTKITRFQSNLLILLEKSLSSNLSLYSHMRSAHMPGAPKLLKSNRFKNLDRSSSKTSQKCVKSVHNKVLVTYLRYYTRNDTTKWHVMPHLPRNQVPQHSTGVPGVQSTTDKTPGHDCKNIKIITLIKGTYKQRVKIAKITD